MQRGSPPLIVTFLDKNALLLESLKNTIKDLKKHNPLYMGVALKEERVVNFFYYEDPLKGMVEVKNSSSFIKKLEKLTTALYYYRDSDGSFAKMYREMFECFNAFILSPGHYRVKEANIALLEEMIDEVYDYEGRQLEDFRRDFLGERSETPYSPVFPGIDDSVAFSREVPEGVTVNPLPHAHVGGMRRSPTSQKLV